MSKSMSIKDAKNPSCKTYRSERISFDWEPLVKRVSGDRRPLWPISESVFYAMESPCSSSGSLIAVARFVGKGQARMVFRGLP